MRAIKLRAPAALILVVLALSSIGSIIIEKRWTEYSPERMQKIAQKRVQKAVAVMNDPRLLEQASRIPWKDPGPEAWATALTDWAGRALDAYPPQQGYGETRLKILEAMDVVVHLELTPLIVEALDRMYHHRIDKAVEEIVETDGVDGVKIWKMYDMGFVVMTRNKCLAFDLHPGRVVSPISDRDIDALARRCDVLFISHRHGDHWHESVVEAFSKHGKPIIAPEGDFWQGEGLQVVRETRELPLSISDVKVWVYPGHQFLRCPCSLYVVEADGMVISHNGDMSAPHPWVQGLKKRHQVDVQLLNCWAIPSFNARGQDANMIVTGHEWELGHDINGRRGYDETQAMLNHKFDRIKLVWGESAAYPGPTK